jgi:hypothetical protein
MSQLDETTIGLSPEELEVLRVNSAPVSYALAVAIGWNENNENAHDLDAHDPDVQIVGTVEKRHLGEPTAQVWVDNAWKNFDFADPQTMAPIIERFDVRPVSVLGLKNDRLVVLGWTARVGKNPLTHSAVPIKFFGNDQLLSNHDKARHLACAMAVIKAHRLGLVQQEGVPA